MRFTPYQQTIVIECDTIEHTEVFPFCSDVDCPCHEDQDNINALNEQVEAGLLTAIEGSRLYWGKQL
jgi:hypothetical protein